MQPSFPLFCSIPDLLVVRRVGATQPLRRTSACTESIPLIVLATAIFVSQFHSCTAEPSQFGAQLSNCGTSDFDVVHTHINPYQLSPLFYHHHNTADYLLSYSRDFSGTLNRRQSLYSLTTNNLTSSLPDFFCLY